MNTLQIPQRNIYKEYPSGWEEIEPKDVPKIGKWLWMLETGELDVDMFRKLVVDLFINRRNSAVMPMEGEKAWDLWANEGQLADTVNFFFRIKASPLPLQKRGDKNASNEVIAKQDGVASATPRNDGETYEVIPNFVKNLVPWVKIGMRKQYGPGDFLGEMCFGEYKDLLFCADKYMRTKNEEWLTRMMAIAYRPRRFLLSIIRKMPGFDGRTRRKYAPGAVDYRLKRFEKLPIGVKYMFFQYLMGCIYTLKTDADGQGIEIDGHLCSFSIVFNRKTETGDGEPQENDDNGVGLTGVIMVLAESGVFGNIEETAKADVWAVLVRLYQLELQRREMEKK